MKRQKKTLGFLGLWILSAVMAFSVGSLNLPSAEAQPFGRPGVDRLMNRIAQLEATVADLSARISFLEQSPMVSADFVTCYIKTPFKGTFFATEPTESAARAVVLYQCGNALGCKENKIKCGQ